jgi:hypothetical protein
MSTLVHSIEEDSKTSLAGAPPVEAQAEQFRGGGGNQTTIDDAVRISPDIAINTVTQSNPVFDSNNAADQDIQRAGPLKIDGVKGGALPFAPQKESSNKSKVDGVNSSRKEEGSSKIKIKPASGTSSGPKDPVLMPKPVGGCEKDAELKTKATRNVASSSLDKLPTLPCPTSTTKKMTATTNPVLAGARVSTVEGNVAKSMGGQSTSKREIGNSGSSKSGDEGSNQYSSVTMPKIEPVVRKGRTRSGSTDDVPLDLAKFRVNPNYNIPGFTKYLYYLKNMGNNTQVVKNALMRRPWWQEFKPAFSLSESRRKDSSDGEGGDGGTGSSAKVGVDSITVECGFIYLLFYFHYIFHFLTYFPQFRPPHSLNLAGLLQTINFYGSNIETILGMSTTNT